MQYSKLTVLNVFIRTAKRFSLQFHSIIQLVLRSKTRDEVKNKILNKILI